MNNLFWGLMTLAIIVALGVLTAVLLELKAATRALRELLKTTDCSVKPTLDELQNTLKSLRNVTDNITAVTEDVKVLSGSVRDVGENVRHVTELVDGVTSTAVIKVSGFRAGVRAAAEVLLKSCLTGKSR